MPSQNHTHTYVQFKTRPGYFRCNAPDCTHFLVRDAVIGKYSLCNDCGAQFIIDFENAKLVYPKCLMCRGSKKAKAFQLGQRLVGNIVKHNAAALEGEEIE